MMDSGEITIIVDLDGNTEITLKGFEEESPKVARTFEEVLGTVEDIRWNPKAHAHTHNGRTIHHSH